MDSKNMYIPNHEKWLTYYENIAKHKHSSPVPGVKSAVVQEEGGLTTLSNQFIIPIEKGKIPRGSNDASKIKLISPSQQTVQQAESEIERTEMKRIKKKRQTKRKLSSKKGSKTSRRKLSKGRRKTSKSQRQRKGSLRNIFV